MALFLLICVSLCLGYTVDAHSTVQDIEANTRTLKDMRTDFAQMTLTQLETQPDVAPLLAEHAVISVLAGLYVGRFGADDDDVFQTLDGVFSTACDWDQRRVWATRAFDSLVIDPEISGMLDDMLSGNDEGGISSRRRRVALDTMQILFNRQAVFSTEPVGEWTALLDDKIKSLLLDAEEGQNNKQGSNRPDVCKVD